MPYIPTYRPGQIGPVQSSNERLRPVDNGAGMIGEALRRTGAAVSNYAIEEDARQARFDEAFARQLALEYKQRADPIVSAFGGLNGKSAVEAGDSTQQQLASLRDEFLQRATRPRMRSFLESQISPAAMAYQGVVGEHAAKQLQVMEEGTARAELAMASNDMARLYENPAEQAKAYQAGIGALDRLAQRMGWSSEQTALERTKWISDTHSAALEQMTATANPDYLMVSAYLEAHADEMTADALADARRALKQPMEDMQAETDASVALAAVAGPMDGQASPVGGYDRAKAKAAIRAPESSGKDNATNRMGSSASGRYQFVRGTFIDTYAKAYGVSREAAAAAWGSKRFDADVQERLMDRLTADNEAALQRIGAPVTVGNVYVMHVLGGGDGPKLFRAAPDDPVSKHLSAQVISQNPTYFGGGKTVRQALATIRGKVEGARHNEAPRQWDKNAAYDSIDRIADSQGWTWARRENAKRGVDKAISRDEELLRRQYSAAEDEAATLIASMGENFTSTAQLPGAVRRNMDPAALAKMEAGLRERQASAERTAQSEAQSVREAQLDFMRRFDPEAFKRVNLMDEFGKVSAKGFARLQGELLEATKFVPLDLVGIRSWITSEIDFQEKHGGVKLDDAAKVRMFDFMESQLAEVHNRKGSIARQDAVAAFHAGNRETPGGTAYFEALTDVPDDVRAEIMSNWPKRTPPTSGQIVQAYRLILERSRK